jgi:hypothetical protein
VATRDFATELITLDLPRSSLVTLENGHKRRERILRGVEKIVGREQVLRIDWADEIAACIVELSTDVDLPALDFDPFILVRGPPSSDRVLWLSELINLGFFAARHR